MYNSTGFTREQVTDIAGDISQLDPRSIKTGWPPCLGLFKSVVVTLMYLRRNRVQAEIAEQFSRSQPTISRAIQAIMPLMYLVTKDSIPRVEDLSTKVVYFIDGSLLPFWSWENHQDLWSGKHKTTGMNIQLAVDHTGKLCWVSDPVAGSMHDSKALTETGIFDHLKPEQMIADKGYEGLEMHTPLKKPINGELSESEHKFNKSINEIRWIVEKGVANFKTWRILHTDYRRPINTFKETIQVIKGLHFHYAT